MNSNITNDLLVSLLLKNYQMKQRVRLDFDQQTVADLKSIHQSLCYFLGFIDANVEDMQDYVDSRQAEFNDIRMQLEDQIDNEQQSVTELLDLVDLKNAEIKELEQRIQVLELEYKNATGSWYTEPKEGAQK